MPGSAEPSSAAVIAATASAVSVEREPLVVQRGVPGIEQRQRGRHVAVVDGQQHRPRRGVPETGDERAVGEQGVAMPLVQHAMAARGVPGRREHPLVEQVAHQLGGDAGRSGDIDGPHGLPLRFEVWTGSECADQVHCRRKVQEEVQRYG